MSFLFRKKTASSVYLHSLVRIAKRHEATLAGYSDSEFESHTRQLVENCSVMSNDKKDRDQLCHRVATGSEAVFRTHGFRLHDVQLLAIVACATGNAVEMQTGEGKTLVAGITGYVRALDGEGVHVATTNDYLAARDHQELVETYRLLNVSSMLLPAQRDLQKCRQAYQSHITYGPGYQFGFDYLHDQLTLLEYNPNGLGQEVLRKINGLELRNLLGQFRERFFTVVDEADSVLIDEAATPLVVSAGPVDEKDAEPYYQAASTVNQMQEGRDYTVSENGLKVELTDHAQRHLHEQLTTSRKRMQLVRPWPEYILNALKAKHTFKRNEHYVVVDGSVQIVDQFTGRIHPDRHWQGGLHQAVEAKEKLEVELRPSSIARVTRQRYYGKYKQMAGMSGTMMNVQNEVKNVYGMRTVKIPTNVPCRRKVLHNRFFSSWEAKLEAIARECKKRNATGQPILIGTRTIRESESIEAALFSQGLGAVVLNGVQDKDEAEIIAFAGQHGAITIATNMAGRGTDIKPSTRSKEVGGVHVIGTEPNSSERVDRQLVGRAARQGDPGSAQFFISAEDDLLITNAPKLVKKMAAACDRTGETQTNFSRDVSRVQMEVEQRAFESRRALVASDKWMDLVRETIVKE